MARIIPTCNPTGNAVIRLRAAFAPALAVLCVVLVGGCAANSGSPTAASAPTANVSPDELVTDSVYGNYLAGRQALDNFDTAAAAELLSAALADDPEEPILLQRTMLAELANGKFATALSIADRIGRLTPHDGNADLIRAVGDMTNGRFTAAVERMKPYDQDDQFGMIGLLITAWGKAGAGDKRGALQAATTLSRMQVFGPFGLYHLALLHEYFGDAREANQAYNELIRKSQTGITRLVLAYSRFLANQGEAGEARIVLMNAQELPGAQVLRADLESLNAGRIPPHLVTTPAEGVAETLFGAANVIERDGSPWTVLLLRLTLEANPKFELARLSLAAQLESRGQYESAMALYNQFGPESIYSETASIRLAWCLYELKRYDQAFALLNQLSKRWPDSAEPPIALGDMYRARDNFAEAAKQYGEALRRIGKPTPSNWSLYYARGIAYERSKNWPLAEADFQQALKLSPNQPEVLNYLGYSWIDQGLNLDQALAMIQKAVEQRPRDGYIVDSLGWGYYKLGRYQDATTWLERAVELSPGDAAINDHLGDALWQVGRKDEARFQWQRALNSKPDPDLEPQIKAKLARGLAPNGS